MKTAFFCLFASNVLGAVAMILEVRSNCGIDNGGWGGWWSCKGFFRVRELSVFSQRVSVKSNGESFSVAACGSRMGDIIIHSPINAVSEIENESVLIEFRERSPFSLNMMYRSQNLRTTQERTWIRHEMSPILRFCDVNKAGVLLDARLHV